MHEDEELKCTTCRQTNTAGAIFDVKGDGSFMKTCQRCRERRSKVAQESIPSGLFELQTDVTVLKEQSEGLERRVTDLEKVPNLMADEVIVGGAFHEAPVPTHAASNPSPNEQVDVHIDGDGNQRAAAPTPGVAFGSVVFGLRLGGNVAAMTSTVASKTFSGWREGGSKGALKGVVTGLFSGVKQMVSAVSEDLGEFGTSVRYSLKNIEDFDRTFVCLQEMDIRQDLNRRSPVLRQMQPGDEISVVRTYWSESKILPDAVQLDDSCCWIKPPGPMFCQQPQHLIQCSYAQTYFMVCNSSLNIHESWNLMSPVARVATFGDVILVTRIFENLRDGIGQFHFRAQLDDGCWASISLTAPPVEWQNTDTLTGADRAYFLLEQSTLPDIQFMKESSIMERDATRSERDAFARIWREVRNGHCSPAIANGRCA